MSAQLTDHCLDLKDYSLFYRQSDLKSGSIPILFLHGWGISTEPYHEVLNLLAQQHPVIAPDLPSFAQSRYSELIPDYETYARLLLPLIEKLEVEQVHLAGHSLGGGIALALATLIPDKVKSLVLIDSTGLPVASIPEIIPKRAIEMIAQISLPKLYLQLFEIPKVFSKNLLFNTGNVIQALLLSLHTDLSHLLPTIKSPCLLVWSEKDLTTPLDAAQKMAVKLPDARIITVEEGFHEWGLWYPERLTSIILDFVQQTSPISVPSPS